MSLEDPFLIVQKYVYFALAKWKHCIRTWYVKACWLIATNWFFLSLYSEVFDALVKLKNNYNTWVNFNENSAATNEVTKDEYNAFLSELKNGIKSLKWDLDELEESLGMLDLFEVWLSLTILILQRTLISNQIWTTMKFKNDEPL